LQVDKRELHDANLELWKRTGGERIGRMEKEIEELEGEVSGLRACIKAKTAMYDSLMRQCDYLEGLARKSKKRAKRYKAALQAVCAVVAGAD